MHNDWIFFFAYSCEAKCVSTERAIEEIESKNPQKSGTKEAHGEGDSPQEPAMDYQKKGELSFLKKNLMIKKKINQSPPLSYALHSLQKIKPKCS